MSVNKVDKTTGELVTLASGTRIWIGTEAAHDLAVQRGTMPNNCMVCITDDAAGEEAWQYSTSETKTGKTWIDGKPIYRKVYSLTAPSTADTNFSIGDLPTNLDTVTFSYFEVDAKSLQPMTSIYPAPSPKMTGSDTEYFSYWFSMDTLKIRARVGSAFVSVPILGTLEYTKTTD